MICSTICARRYIFCLFKKCRVKFFLKLFTIHYNLLQNSLSRFFLPHLKMNLKIYHTSKLNTTITLYPKPYVGWVSWFSTLLREVFLRVLRFSRLIKNRHLISPQLVEHLCLPNYPWDFNKVIIIYIITLRKTVTFNEVFARNLENGHSHLCLLVSPWLLFFRSS